MVFSDFSKVWSKTGHVNKALLKGPKTTTSIWNLHADAHDFDMEDSALLRGAKVFSSNIAHLSLVFSFLAGVHFYGAYFSNFVATLEVGGGYPLCRVSAGGLWAGYGGSPHATAALGYAVEGTLTAQCMGNLWRSAGIMGTLDLRACSTTSILLAMICILGSYFHMHVSWGPFRSRLLASSCEASVASFGSLHALVFDGWDLRIRRHHLCVLAGAASLAWAGHQIHVSSPRLRILDSGVAPYVIPAPSDFLAQENVLPNVLDDSLYGPLRSASLPTAAHHFYVAIALLGSSFFYRSTSPRALPLTEGPPAWGSILSINLAMTGQLSIAFANSHAVIAVYPNVTRDFACALSLFCHHMVVGAFLVVGASASASLEWIRGRGFWTGSAHLDTVRTILQHRDVLTTTLIWVCVFLGLHSVTIYLHNDAQQALGREEMMFGDNSIQLKPLFALWLYSFGIFSFDTEVFEQKLVRITAELGTADFMLHHIHAFTIHTTLLILLKSFLYARSSRLVSAKSELGFRTPCDGPGRGGTCQISSFDHTYLGLFWMYNAIACALFHYFWKMQSDVQGTVNYNTLSHLSPADFSANSTTINGWLRNFLWSQASSVIESYGTPLAGYSLIFIGAHFVWAFSLMFLYSGRGYWQELIESILWAHNKWLIVPNIQPRALSISSGRALGLVHYIVGALGCTYAFFIARVLAS
jgi:photosystem I P700 chlorophyll a apoprotein A1